MRETPLFRKLATLIRPKAVHRRKNQSRHRRRLRRLRFRYTQASSKGTGFLFHS